MLACRVDLRLVTLHHFVGGHTAADELWESRALEQALVEAVVILPCETYFLLDGLSLLQDQFGQGLDLILCSLQLNLNFFQLFLVGFDHFLDGRDRLAQVGACL